MLIWWHTSRRGGLGPRCVSVMGKEEDPQYDKREETRYEHLPSHGRPKKLKSQPLTLGEVVKCENVNINEIVMPMVMYCGP